MDGVTNPATQPQPSTFVGRDQERAALLARLDAIGSGGGVVLLLGEPGIGKTRTAEELGYRAVERGVRVLWGRCYEGEGAPPFWPWIQVVRGYLRDADPARLSAELGGAAPVVAQLVPDLHQLLGPQPPPPALDPEPARFQLLDGITRFLFAMARQQPALVVLDDLHWADSATLLQLQFMARELASVPLLVLGTYRDVEVVRGGPLARALADLARLPAVTRLPLGGLSAAELAALLAAATGRTPPATLVTELLRETEGNPFFACEIVRLLSADGQFDAWVNASSRAVRLAIPHTVRDAIGRRLDLLSNESVAILTIAAVLGREFQLRALEAVAVAAAPPDAPQDADAVLDALEEAEARAIVAATPANPGWYRFSHALIRDTLYEALPTTRRIRLHRLAGEALERLYGRVSGTQLAELASHFVRAAPARDAAKAVRYERWAGDHAATVYAYAEAAQHYASALHILDLAGEDSEEMRAEGSPLARCDLLLSLGNAQRMAGDAEAGRDSLLRAVALARQLNDSERLCRGVRGIAGDVPQRRAGDPLVAGLLDEALRRLGDEESHERAMLLIRLATELYYLPQLERSLELGAAAAALAQRLGDAEAYGYVLRFQALAGAIDPEERLARGRELVQLARAAQHQTLEMSGHGWVAIGLLEHGDAAGCDAALAEYASLVEQTHHPSHQVQVLMLRATRAAMAGRFAEAEALAGEGARLAARAGRGDAESAYTSQLFILRLLQGQLDGLKAPIDEFIAREPGVPAWRCGAASLYTELELREEARAIFESLAVPGFEALPRDGSWLPALAALAECCAFLDDGARAAQLYALLLPFERYTIVGSGGAGCIGSVARTLGRLAWTMRRRDDAERHFEAALAMNARVGAVPWLALTRYNYAAMLLARGRAGDRERAGALLAPALATAEELGMATLARRGAALAEQLRSAAAPQTAAPERPALPDGLSEREVQVLRLIAAGLSNREIADNLVLSVRTVETHLNRAYAKIGARGRGDAIAYVFRNGLT